MDAVAAVPAVGLELTVQDTEVVPAAPRVGPVTAYPFGMPPSRIAAAAAEQVKLAVVAPFALFALFAA